LHYPVGSALFRLATMDLLNMFLTHQFIELCGARTNSPRLFVAWICIASVSLFVLPYHPCYGNFLSPGYSRKVPDHLHCSLCRGILSLFSRQANASYSRKTLLGPNLPFSHISFLTSARHSDRSPARSLTRRLSRIFPKNSSLQFTISTDTHATLPHHAPPHQHQTRDHSCRPRLLTTRVSELVSHSIATPLANAEQHDCRESGCCSFLCGCSAGRSMDWGFDAGALIERSTCLWFF
jgi:hypothetical protein